MSQLLNNTSSCLPHPYDLLFVSLSHLPLSHFLFFVVFLLILFLYDFLELHFFRHLLSGFRGDPVCLTYSSNSDLYQSVVAKCRILHGKFSPTPWLCSPHLQTVFLSLFGWSPRVTYRRHLFRTRDGGTLALDWIMHSELKDGSAYVQDNQKAPILVVIPGLTSDSSSPYVTHLAFKLARRGWNVVVCNHRGLGGISVTSDCFYSAGWTEDVREIINDIHCQYPDSPVYAVGTSLGANILVKYLGEEGMNVSLNGAAAVCPPWDLLICDRFMNRRLAQKLYDRALAVGLQGYAQLHRSVLSRLVEWDGIIKSRSVREFDDSATRVLGKFETVDAYYRRSSCVNFVGNVSLPLLCISALDDPVCSREAIPFDECRLKENIVLAATKHGGHLGYYEGIRANSMWWVRAVDEFLHVLHSSDWRHIKKMKLPSPVETSIDQGPFVNVMEDGMVAAVGTIETEKAVGDVHDKHTDPRKNDTIFDGNGTDEMSEKRSKDDLKQRADQNLTDSFVPIRKRVDQLSRQSKNSIWLLAYIALVTTWPLFGSSLLRFFKKKSGRITAAT